MESPLGDFFCCGFARDCIVNSLPICVVPARGFNCYFQMPFGKRARITLENQHETELECFFYQVDYLELDEQPEDTLYFHAQWRREKLTQLLAAGFADQAHFQRTFKQHFAATPGQYRENLKPSANNPHWPPATQPLSG